MSAAGRMLSKALETPEDWELDDSCAKHEPSGTIWYTNSGPLFFNGHRNTPPCLQLFERVWLYYKFKRMVNNMIAGAIATGVIKGRRQ